MWVEEGISELGGILFIARLEGCVFWISYLIYKKIKLLMNCFPRKKRVKEQYPLLLETIVL